MRFDHRLTSGRCPSMLSWNGCSRGGSISRGLTVDDFDIDLPDEGGLELKVSPDGETVLVVNRTGQEVEVSRFGPTRRSPRGGFFRSKVIVDECAHDGKTEATKVKRHDYGTSYCPLCDGSRGKDGLWRVLEDA